MADSDAFVGPDTWPFVTRSPPRPVGGSRHLHLPGRAHGKHLSRLGAMYINEWYVPRAAGLLFGYERYVRARPCACGRPRCARSADWRRRRPSRRRPSPGRTGERAGLRIVLSPYVVEGEHTSRLRVPRRHEIRWMRTIRVLRPAAFRLIFLSFSFPVACAGLLSRRWIAAAPALGAVRHHALRSAGFLLRAPA